MAGGRHGLPGHWGQDLEAADGPIPVRAPRLSDGLVGDLFVRLSLSAAEGFGHRSEAPPRSAPRSIELAQVTTGYNHGEISAWGWPSYEAFEAIRPI